MRRTAILTTTFASALAPATASALEPGMAGDGVQWLFGVAMLMAAVALLLISLGLARVAQGSAMADNISYVVLAAVCLAGSVLAQWAVRFVPDPVVGGQVQLGGQALVIAAIAFFCIYFYRVRAALRRFLSEVTGSDALARAHMPTADATDAHGADGDA